MKIKFTENENATLQSRKILTVILRAFLSAFSILVKKHEKLCIKSDFKDICLKLATNGQSDNAFLLTSGFVHKGLSVLATRLYICGKTLKNVYKIRIQRFV